ncbi:MAG: CHAP domain-containing protein [Devosia sp.]
MEILAVTSRTKLRTTPAEESTFVMQSGMAVAVFPFNVLASSQDVGGGWSKIVMDTGGGVGPEGFLPTAKIVTKTIKGAAIEQTAFAAICAGACTSFGVDLPYLLAVARTETRTSWKDGIIAADVYRDTGACGPFQFIKSTWEGLVRELGAQFGIRLSDIIDPGKQAALAAYTTKDAMSRHQISFGGLPSPAELYLYHFFGWPTALRVLKGAQADRIDALLMTVYNDQARVNQIMSGNASLLQTSGMPRSLAGVIDEVAGRLQQSYEQNLPLLLDAPLWWPGTSRSVGGGPAPWLDLGLAEQGQSEIPGPSGNPRIAEYLTTVGFGAGTSDETPWCAAFVSWCLRNSGDAAAADTAKNLSDRSFAKSWLGLKDVVLTPVPGSIGITKPYSTDTTGHVGIVAEVQEKGVLLLAGNQRPPGGAGPDTVCKKFIPLVDFVGFRWPKS